MIVNAPYNAHTRAICKNLNVMPVDDLYESLLMRRYKQGIKTSNLCLKELANLTERVHVYDTRGITFRFTPRTRTNYGRQIIAYTLPTRLNNQHFFCNAAAVNF